MDSDERIRIGNEARAIIENPLVKDFFDNYIQKLFVDWSNATSAEERERLWNLSEAAKLFKHHFSRYIISGTIEERKHAESSGTGSDGTGTGVV